MLKNRFFSSFEDSFIKNYHHNLEKAQKNLEKMSKKSIFFQCFQVLKILLQKNDHQKLEKTQKNLKNARKSLCFMDSCFNNTDKGGLLKLSIHSILQ